jgi:Protein of unknown function (DUF4236)
MGWRFRQSFTVVPGLRFNLSNSGLSASIGSAPFTLNLGPHGVQGTVSIPGTGLSYHHRFTPSAESPGTGSGFLPSLPNHTPHPHFLNTAPIEEVHSASTGLLTSETLKQVKQIITDAQKQQQDICRELDDARTAKVDWEGKYLSWRDGVLLKKLFKKTFAERKETFETESARVAELEEQQKLSVISAQIEVEGKPADMYYRLRDEFAALCECAAIWDVGSHQAADKFHERTVADMKITRESPDSRWRVQPSHGRYHDKAEPSDQQTAPAGAAERRTEKVAKFCREITSEGAGSHMARSQFPNELIDAWGHKIRRPATW